MTATTGSHDARRLRLALLGVMMAVLMAMLDTMIVGTAMPTIARDLGGLDHVSWVVAAYTLATAAVTPVWGKAGDLYGRKRVFLAAIVVFLAGSGLSGAAGSMIQLILFRALQGLGAGGLSVGAFAVIGELVAPRERGRYQGMTASVIALGTIGGPLLGGIITGAFGWRWVFYINIPLGMLTLAWCQWILRLPAKRSTARIDWLGAMLVTLTVSALMLAATWGGVQFPWLSWQTGALIAVAAGGLGSLLFSQRRAAEPVLPLHLFASRNFGMTMIMTFATGVAFYGASLYFPLFQQVVQGETATSSGLLLLLPMMLPVVVMSQLSGKIMSRTGRYKIFPVLGSAFLTAGLLLWATVGAGTPRLLTIGYMIVVGAGLGLLLQMTTTIAQNSVQRQDLGVASANVTLFRTMGGSLGLALFGALLNHAVQHRTGAASAVSGATAVPSLARPAESAYLHAMASGIDNVCLAAAIACGAALAAALLIKQVTLRSRAQEPVPPPEPSQATSA